MSYARHQLVLKQGCKFLVELLIISRIDDLLRVWFKFNSLIGSFLCFTKQVRKSLSFSFWKPPLFHMYSIWKFVFLDTFIRFYLLGLPNSLMGTPCTPLQIQIVEAKKLKKQSWWRHPWLLERTKRIRSRNRLGDCLCFTMELGICLMTLLLLVGSLTSSCSSPRLVSPQGLIKKNIYIKKSPFEFCKFLHF